MPSTPATKMSLLFALSLFLSPTIAQTATGDSCPQAPTFPNTTTTCNKWHTIPTDGSEGCDTVETEFGITSAQFLAWNPDVSADCTTNFWAGYAYCVGVGESTCSTSSGSSTSLSSTTTTTTTTGISSTSSTGTSSGSTVTTGVTTTSTTANATYSTRFPITGYNLTTTTVGTAWPPERTQSGQPSYCNSWHLVSAGETCSSIAGASRVTLDNLLAWNPSLGSDCQYLFINWWICDGIQPQTSSTLPWSTTETDTTIPASTAWTSTTYPAINSSFAAVPVQTGIPSDCQAYYFAQADDNCNTILAEYDYITEAQFMAWNPALAGNCNGLWVGYWYCVAAFSDADGDYPVPATVTTVPSPTGTGSPSDCAAWYLTTLGDDCDTLVAEFGSFSEEQLIEWNPSVWSDCSNVVEGTYYCVAVPGSPTTRTTTLPTSTTAPSSIPTQTGMADDCGDNVWLVSDSDTCASVVSANGISLDNFESWNPAVVASDGSCSLTTGYYVCVGSGSNTTTTTSSTSTGAITTTTSTSSTSTSAPATTTTSSGGAVTTPSPIQSGMTSGCVRFYWVESGDGCWAIADSAGIDLDDFYAWNPAVGTDCSGLWSDVYVCIGITGVQATTITSGAPVPAPTS